MIGGRGIVLVWLSVAGADDYEVEISPAGTAHNPDVNGLSAQITGLTPGTNYTFRVRACNPSCDISASPLYSLWSDPRVHEDPAPEPTADGHQADHTVGYMVGSITSSPDLPDGVPDAAAVIRAAINPAAAAWNSAMQELNKDLKICDVVSDRSCSGRNPDGGIVTIETRVANPEGEGGVLSEPCGKDTACAYYGQGAVNGHLGHMTIVFEEPAWWCRSKPSLAGYCDDLVRIYWTDESALSGIYLDEGILTEGNPPSRYEWVGRVMRHEFGHPLGLTDFYDTRDKTFHTDDEKPRLRESDMKNAVMHTGSEIHAQDIAQLRAIYLLHDPADHGY